MTVTIFVGIYFLAKGLHLYFIKRTQQDKARTFVTVGCTIIIISSLDELGIFRKLVNLIVG